jgi:hypothetical protein
MLDQQYRFTIHKDEDIDKYRKDFDKINHIHLDLRNHKLSNDKFIELFERLSATKLEDAHFDFEGLCFEESELSAIIKCLSCWDLRKCSLNFDNVRIPDTQFERLIDALRFMGSLEKLNLRFRNIGMNDYKLKALCQHLEKVHNLENFFIDISGNGLEKEQIVHLSKVMNGFKARELIWE